jgi:hypothetical protein
MAGALLYSRCASPNLPLNWLFQTMTAGASSGFTVCFTRMQARINGHLFKNETEVVRYQKYTADSTVIFGDR